MKYIVILTILVYLFSCKDSTASIQSDDKKVAVIFGFNYPFHGNLRDFTINPELEVLFFNKDIKKAEMSVGLGLQRGNQIWIENIYNIGIVDGHPWPTSEYTRFWELTFYSINVPVYFTIPINYLFFEAIVPGFSFGRNFANKLYLEYNPNIVQKLNKTYLDLNFGIKKNLYKNRVHFIPSIGRMIYLSDHNSWQKDYFFFEFKLQVICNSVKNLHEN